ncbi:MAG: hypothetical protein KatS3mg010_1470 [Acidimicrobiia bacterium]|nr:MAG: hypothetical protein KatS3mg010_1470 [Acidimicrobiia bacterium]
MVTREPVFGLPAAGCPRSSARRRVAGHTVVDRASVITTHLAEVVRRHAGRAARPPGREGPRRRGAPVGPRRRRRAQRRERPTGEIQRVLQLLLDEGVGIRDLVRILEALGERCRQSRDPEQLLEAVRAALGPAISASYARDGKLPVLTLEPVVEHSLAEALRTSDQGSFLALEPGVAEALALAIAREAEAAEMKGVEPVFVCAAQLRPALRRLLRAAAPRLPVLAYTELGSQLELETIGVVNLGQPAAV